MTGENLASAVTPARRAAGMGSPAIGQELSHQKRMLDALTALRFFAAAMIVLGHGHALFGSLEIANTVPLEQGVSFFFVLSGFILTYNYPAFRSRESVLNFFVSRFARVWPLHAVTCVIWIGLIFEFKPQAYFPGATGLLKLVANLSMVQAWIPLKDWALTFNGVSWSISDEFFFYLAFPLIIMLWRRYWHVLLAVSGALVILILGVCNYLKLPADDNFAGVGVQGLVYFGPVVRIFEFMIGVGTASILRRIGTITLSRPQWLLFELGTIGGVVAALLSVAPPVGIDHAFGVAGAYYFKREGVWLFWAVLIGVFASSAGPVARLLSTRPMIFLGEISFSLYLIHAVVIGYLDGYADRVTASGSFGVIAFWTTCLSLAALLFMGIERPCRAMILSWWAKHNRGGRDRRRVPYGLREIGSLTLLLVACSAFFVFRPSTVAAISADDATAFLADPATVTGSGGVFSNGVQVLGMHVARDVHGSVRALVLMRSERAIKLESIIAVHLNDANGAIIVGLGDVPLDKAATRVDAGTYWTQAFPLSPAGMQGASAIAFAMYNRFPELLTVTGGSTDWDHHRLILNIK
jgi:peptidoglycan/LPS O-acetylase OafA/YrhL